MNYSNFLKSGTKNVLQLGQIVLLYIVCNCFSVSLNAQSPDTIRFDDLQNQNKLVYAIVIDSGPFPYDNPLSHTWYTDPCPFTSRPVILTPDAVIKLLDMLLNTTENSDNGQQLSTDDLTKGKGLVFCPTDYAIHVRPLKQYENLLGQGQGKIMEIEIENHYFQSFYLGNYLEPKPGDLLFTAGRWIVDCGHSNFLTEIHPPAVIAYSRAEKYHEIDATRASLWVNNFYTGDTVILNVYPPPRPSPTAKLIVTAEKGLIDTITNKIVVNDYLSEGYLRIIISNTVKHKSSVSDFGELNWSLGGGTYRSLYHVYWEEPN